jgi:hypothetical protein
MKQDIDELFETLEKLSTINTKENIPLWCLNQSFSQSHTDISIKEINHGQTK